MMIHTLLVTHGPLAQALLDSAREIVGQDRLAESPIEVLCLDWGAGLEEATALLQKHLDSLPDDCGVLVLTGLHGATPAKAACRLEDPERVHVVTGVNLAMVVRLACCPPDHLETPAELADWLVEKGRSGVRHETLLCEATQVEP